MDFLKALKGSTKFNKQKFARDIDIFSQKSAPEAAKVAEQPRRGTKRKAENQEPEIEKSDSEEDQQDVESKQVLDPQKKLEQVSEFLLFPRFSA